MSKASSLNLETQSIIDKYDWYGAILALSYAVDDNYIKDELSKAIALIKPNPNVEELIANYGLKQLLCSYQDNLAKNTPCQQELNKIFSSIIDDL